MTRDDLFDVSSLPGFADLARAGRVAPDPAALAAARAGSTPRSRPTAPSRPLPRGRTAAGGRAAVWPWRLCWS